MTRSNRWRQGLVALTAALAVWGALHAGAAVLNPSTVSQTVAGDGGMVFGPGPGAKLVGYQNLQLDFFGIDFIVTSYSSTGNLVALAATNFNGPNGSFTPGATGLYKLVVYGSVTTVGSAGTITINGICTDADQALSVTVPIVTSGTITAKVAWGGATLLNCSSATAVQVSTTFNAVTGSPAYSVYAVLERIS
jgi:hypothetical protein